MFHQNHIHLSHNPSLLNTKQSLFGSPGADRDCFEPRYAELVFTMTGYKKRKAP